MSPPDRIHPWPPLTRGGPRRPAQLIGATLPASAGAGDAPIVERWRCWPIRSPPAVQSTVVSEELQASLRSASWPHEREERRRLRRELHDGLGPTLRPASPLPRDAAANTMDDRSRPVRGAPAHHLCGATRRAALADVRRHWLTTSRPPALDELGLAGALRQRADQLCLAG